MHGHLVAFRVCHGDAERAFKQDAEDLDGLSLTDEDFAVFKGETPSAVEAVQAVFGERGEDGDVLEAVDDCGVQGPSVTRLLVDVAAYGCGRDWLVQLYGLGLLDHFFHLKGCQILVHELDGDGAFTHGGGTTLDRSMTDVACDEDAGDAGLQQVRVAIQLPGVSGFFEVRAGEEEAFIVAGEAAGEPVGAGFGADEDEDGGGVAGLLLILAADGDLPKVTFDRGRR